MQGNLEISPSLASLAGAPDSADYLVGTANATLTAERVVTDTTSITWDLATAGQAKAKRAALTGDVTASADANVTTIANDAVTYAKMQNIAAASRLLGRGSAAGSGDPEELTVGSGLSLSGTALSATTQTSTLLDGSVHTDTVAQTVSRGSLIYGSATPKWDELVIGATNRVLRSDGTDPSWAQVVLTTDVSGDLPFANLTQGDALSVLGVTGNAAADVASIAAGSDHQVLRRSGTALTFGAVNLAQAAAITGTLPAANGGTGIASYAVGDVLYASGATALSALADVATGNALISGGVTTAPLWGKIGLTTHVSGTLALGNGGTGSTAFTAGSIVFSDGTTLAQDNAKLFWDDSNNRLGLGTASPSSFFTILLTAANQTGIEIINSLGNQVAAYSVSGANNGEITVRDSGGTVGSAIRGSGSSYFVGGNTGFGTNSPGTLLHVLAVDDTTAVTVAINATQANVTASDKFVSFTSTSGEEANVVGTAVAGVIAYNTFTGSHWSQSETIAKKVLREKTDTEDALYAPSLIPGTVLVSVDAMCVWGEQENLTLPKCAVSALKEDPAVYGVYGGHDREGDIYVLSVGAGVALVCDEGGTIRIGDLLTTSSTPGHAMRYAGNDPRAVLGKARQALNAPTGVIAITLLAG